MINSYALQAIDDIQVINHKTIILLQIQKARLVSGEVSIFEEDSGLSEDYMKGKVEEMITDIDNQIASAEKAILDAEEAKANLE
jgi:hypothetical protein